jgi:SagB-type dehydrogenase family enzyme
MKAPANLSIVSLADIAHGIPQPAHEKPYPEDALKITLPPIDAETAPKVDLFKCMSERASRRNYSDEPISLAELAFLLFCSQGVKGTMGAYYKYMKNGKSLIRSVPSAGARNPYETYLAINRVDGVEKGIWRYLPLSHELLFISSEQDLSEKLLSTFSNPDRNRHYAVNAAVVFFWAALPYRGEWRYTHMSHKIMLIDVGCICQNLYLATEAISCGCSAVGGYIQKNADDLLQIDGENEFTVFCAAVGRKKEYKDLKKFYRNMMEFISKEYHVSAEDDPLHSDLLKKVERMTDPFAFNLLVKGIRDILTGTYNWSQKQINAVDDFLLHRNAPMLSQMRKQILE